MLKELLQGILGGGASKPNSGLLESGIKVLLNPNGPTGGLPGLVEIFKKKGLGPDILEQIAGSVGLSKGAASGQLAKYLPNIINKLTPKGEIPKETTLADKGLEILKGLLQ